MGFVVIFAIAAAGSVVCISAELALKLIARRQQGATLIAGPVRGESTSSVPSVDPVLSFGFILSCYGAIALALVVALPGALALERTVLTFALLGVGGLIAEIAKVGTSHPVSNVDEPEAESPAQIKPVSVVLSVALMLALNGAVGVLASGQGLIEIVPPATATNAGRAQEFDPIVVVAQRTYDPVDRLSSSL